MIKFELMPSINKDLKQVEQKLKEVTETKFSLLYRISNRLLNAGGKRLRPLLVLLSGKLNDHSAQDLISIGASVELLHMATLIHDDVIDNSLHRRSENTINQDWGNKVAVLSGDLLYTQALKLLVEHGNDEIVNYMLDIVGLICEGEAKQAVTNHDLNQDMKDYINKITKKTALLIGASCKLGAMVSQVDAKKAAAMESYGKNLGIAFQIINDLNDIVADKEELGKEPGDDLRQGTLTLPVLYALDNSIKKEFLRKLLSAVIIPKQNKKAIGILKNSGAIKHSIEISRDYINQALDTLTLFSDSPAKNALQLITQTVINSYKGLEPLETGIKINN